MKNQQSEYAQAIILLAAGGVLMYLGVYLYENERFAAQALGLIPYYTPSGVIAWMGLCFWTWGAASWAATYRIRKYR